MLEGLEAVEIYLSKCKGVIDFRIDSNTYKKEYLLSDRLLMSRKTKSIGDISTSIQNFGAYSLCNFINFQDSGIPFLMTKNVRRNFIDWNIEKFIDNKSHEMLKKSHCRRGQVLVTMAGEYLGRAAVYNSDDEASSNQAIAKVSLNNGQSPYTVSTFLNSKYGQDQIQRFRTITGQPNINMGLIEAIRVPDFSMKFSNCIELQMEKIDKLRLLTSDFYLNAERLLLEELSINTLVFNCENVNVKSFKDSFAFSGRLDSEYYQPRYEQLISHILLKPHVRLADVVVIKKSIEPGSDCYSDDDEGTQFLRLADYSKFGISISKKRLSSNFFNENEEKISSLKPKKDTILFSKDGSVGEAFCLREDAEFITSGAIIHLTIKNDLLILPEYLTLVLNSTLVRMQAERDAGGSIILHWRVSEIENVLVPLVNLAIQQKITDLVQQSFTLKSQCDNLLEAVKRTVEIAIEQDEAAGMAYLAREGALS